MDIASGAPTSGGAAISESKQVLKLFPAEIGATEDFVQQTGSNDLTRVNRRHCAPPVLVTKEAMAAFDPQ